MCEILQVIASHRWLPDKKGLLRCKNLWLFSLFSTFVVLHSIVSVPFVFFYFKSLVSWQVFTPRMSHKYGSPWFTSVSEPVTFSFVFSFCSVAFPVDSIVICLLFSLFYVTREFHRFLHRRWAKKIDKVTHVYDIAEFTTQNKLQNLSF